MKKLIKILASVMVVVLSATMLYACNKDEGNTPEEKTQAVKVIDIDLTQENYEQIAVLMLEELVEPLQDKGIAFAWDDKAIETIARLSVDGPRGARDLRNVIRRNVEDVVAAKIVDSADSPIKSASVTAEGDNIICNFE